MPRWAHAQDVRWLNERSRSPGGPSCGPRASSTSLRPRPADRGHQPLRVRAALDALGVPDGASCGCRRSPPSSCSRAAGSPTPRPGSSDGAGSPRTPAPDDGRGVLLRLTDEGRAGDRAPRRRPRRERAAAPRRRPHPRQFAALGEAMQAVRDAYAADPTMPERSADRPGLTMGGDHRLDVRPATAAPPTPRPPPPSSPGPGP